MKKPVPIATDIPAATVPVIGTCCEAVVVNVQSPSDFHVQLTQSQYQLHRLDPALLPWCSVTMVFCYHGYCIMCVLNNTSRYRIRTNFRGM